MHQLLNSLEDLFFSRLGLLQNMVQRLLEELTTLKGKYLSLRLDESIEIIRNFTLQHLLWVLNHLLKATTVTRLNPINKRHLLPFLGNQLMIKG